MKFLTVAVLLLTLTACSSNKTVNTPTPPPAPETPIVTAPMPTEAVIANILLTATTSNVATLVWKDRGVAPIAYVKGMSILYAKAYCRPNAVVSEALGSTDKDALAYYGIEATNRNAYAFLFGLGMRESSGKHCTGRDGSANNIASDTAEAGMFQTSYDSRGAHASLVPLFKNYSDKCHLEFFKERVTCSASNAKNWGNGADGLAFQKKLKECPAFAAEYAAITVRKLRKHYGPINRKEVQFRSEVVQLFASIEKIVDANPEVCTVL